MPNNTDKKRGPAPPDFTGIATKQAGEQNALLGQQTLANRPDQSNPYASSTWQQGPDGRWNQSTQFTGPMGDINKNLQAQAASAMGTPLSFEGLPQVGTGEAAREQAINSAYGQATSRLDPAFAAREEATRSRLMNQGLQPGSEAFEREMSMLGRERNDAYGGAMSNAISQGTAAGSALFSQNLAGRQQALEELLRQRGQPLAELGQMNGFTGMSGFNAAGLGQAPQYLAAGGMQHNADVQNWQTGQQNTADAIGGGMQLASIIAQLAPLLSDERAKEGLARLPEEVIPGVPAATFRYRPEFGLGSKTYVGVSAQDLQRVMPEAVTTRPDGLLEVHPAFRPLPLEDES